MNKSVLEPVVNAVMSALYEIFTIAFSLLVIVGLITFIVYQELKK